MTHEEFEAIVHQVVNGLPPWVHEAFDNIDLLVEDAATADQHPDSDGLLGLYLGVPLPERDANHSGELPDVIYIFRLPHLSMGLDEDGLRNEIATTVIHEIAHYFGIDDDHLDELGWG
jgi:predicted Zn-dependent protease with MMP-like domain